MKTELFNKKNKDDLRLELQKEDFKRITISFYRYVNLTDIDILRDELYIEWRSLNILGRVYIATEGINAQLSIPEKKLDLFINKLYSRTYFNNIEIKKAVEDGESFYKLIIKVKNEIVAYKIPKNQYNMKTVGKHLNYLDFNKAIDNGATIVDVRNYYEAEVGKFENAIIPDIDRSEDLLPEIKRLLKGQEQNKILMYCTGGIRCEKASFYLRNKGFKNVYQLNGGIIEYTRQVKEHNLENKFLGKNFVFDNRRSERISGDIISNCHQCGDKCDEHVNCNNEACHLLFIQCESCAKKYDGCCSIECSEINSLLIEKQKELRRGKKNSNKIFKKGRFKEKPLNKI